MHFPLLQGADPKNIPWGLRLQMTRYSSESSSDPERTWLAGAAAADGAEAVALAVAGALAEASVVCRE